MRLRGEGGREGGDGGMACNGGKGVTCHVGVGMWNGGLDRMSNGCHDKHKVWTDPNKTPKFDKWKTEGEK